LKVRSNIIVIIVLKCLLLHTEEENVKLDEDRNLKVRSTIIVIIVSKCLLLHTEEENVSGCNDR
jgi:hypothetical protein